VLPLISTLLPVLLLCQLLLLLLERRSMVCQWLLQLLLPYWR
jgi:hypothetical protein